MNNLRTMMTTAVQQAYLKNLLQRHEGEHRQH